MRILAPWSEHCGPVTNRRTALRPASGDQLRVITDAALAAPGRLRYCLGKVSVNPIEPLNVPIGWFSPFSLLYKLVKNV